MNANITVPNTACDIDEVRDYCVTIAEYKIDTRSIYKEFKGKKLFSRQDVKDWIKNNKGSIACLGDLEKAIRDKRGDAHCEKVMKDVYDEIIDKMVDCELLAFPYIELAPDFERRLIKKWAERF